MQTLFYFNDVSELANFEAFEVQPVSDSHATPAEPTGVVLFWSVVGTLKAEKAEGLNERQFPVADLPTELYAGLFATLCKRLTSMQEGG